MALKPAYLVDTSALARLHIPSVFDTLDAYARSGLIATCSMTDLEVGYSARNHTEHRLITAQRRGMPRAVISQHTLDRALDVQALLARTTHHRVSLPDLIVAACAEEHRLTVVHYDTDFDTIARATGQPTLWVAPRGSL